MLPAPLRTALAPAAALFLVVAAVGEDEPAPAGPDFETEVLPLLEARCAECHGEHLRRPKARLLLTRAGLLEGGVAGPALVPGDPDASLVVQAVRYEDELLQMPPKERLPAEEVDLLERWVAAGAPWPEGLRAVWREEAAGASEPDFSPEDLAYFEREVRPLLAESCFDCHGPEVERPKAGLRMSSRASLLAGGDSGPALVPGDPEASLLVELVRYESERKMPPPGRLPDEDVAVLEAWVARGAPWPPGETAGAPAEPPPSLDVEAGRRRWAFRPAERPPVPAVEHADLVDSPIDAFVLAELEERGIEPAPLATPRELLRRLAFDLVGLPPTVEEVRAFEEAYARDPDAAFAAAVDELLARPEHGERWARHWLDVVRFAQTNGYERDTEKPFAWRYRDWVIDALNADLPYDDFVRYQLAGDELEEAGPDGLVATGFYRLGAWDDEPADPVEAEFDELDDVLRTISEGMMGVTLGCARCHDHRFDPFPQEDYYSLLAFVRGVAPYEPPEFSFSSPTLRPLDDSPEAVERWRADQREAKRSLVAEQEALVASGRRGAVAERLDALPPAVRRAYEKQPGQRTEDDLALLREARELRPSVDDALRALSPEEKLRYREIAAELQGEGTSSPGSLPWALAVREVGSEPPPTHLLLRGRAASPGREVAPRFPRVLVASDAAAMPPPPEHDPGESSGRRTALAEWIASPGHPLTARVIANRVWQHHFGRGIVATPNDFGSTGIAPTHPELLDWLAAELVDSGWSLKALHRAILTSRTWRQSSRHRDERALEVDPANDLLWRQRTRRVEAEVLRDALLAVSGTLNPERGGRGFFPAISREALAGMSKPGLGWEPSSAEQRARRAVYAYAMRGLAVPFLQVFDAPSASLPVGARPTTTLATQALTLLNSDLAGRAAAALADAVAGEAGASPGSRVERLYERALARGPDAEERRLALDFLAAQTAAFREAPRELVFAPRVPERLEVGYYERLADDEFLYGPREHWRYLRGRWGGGYNATLQWDPLDGPAALLAEPLADAGTTTLRAVATVERGAEAVLVLGAERRDDTVRGAEVVLRGTDGGVVLRTSGGAGEVRVLAEAAGAFEPGAPFDLEVSRSATDLRVAVAGREVASAELPADGGAGLAVRVRGAALRLERPVLESGGVEHALEDAPVPAEQRALRSLALVLLNHNEFAYVD